MTPQGHFVSLERQLSRAARQYKTRQLETYLASPEFFTAIAALSDADRVRAFAFVAESVRSRNAAKDRIAPLKPYNRLATPRTPIKWDEMTKARFQKALRHGDLEEGARAVGITLPAAKRAAKRQGLPYKRVASATVERHMAA